MKKESIIVFIMHSFSSVFICGSIFSARELISDKKINSNLFLIVAVFFVCEFISLLLMHFASRRIGRIRAGVKSLLMSRFSHNISNPNSKYHLESGAEGRIATLQNSDLLVIGNFVASVLVTFVPALIMLIVFTCVSAYSFGAMGLFACVLSVGQLPISFAIGKLQPRFRKVQNLKLDLLSAMLMNWMTQFREFRTGKLQDLQENKLLKIYNEHLKSAVFEHLVSIFLFVVSFCWWLVPVFISVIYAQHVKIFDTEIVSKILASTWILITLSNALRRVPMTISLLEPAKIAMQRISPYLINTPEIRNIRIFVKSSIEEFGRPVAWMLNGVSVSFSAKIVFRNVNHKISMNEHIWIIGEQGAGKTTFMELLFGLKSPDAGWVGVLNEDGRQFDLKNPAVRDWLHHFVKPVPQSSFLFQGDLQSNVSLKCVDVKEGIVQKSIENSCLAGDFSSQIILQNAQIKEEGRNLSGGQRQRVSIGRALSFSPECVIFDQSFSAIDSFTASLIYGNLRRIENLRGAIFLSSAPPEFSADAALFILTSDGLQKSGGLQ